MVAMADNLDSYPWMRIGPTWQGPYHWVGGPDRVLNTPINVLRTVARHRAYLIEKHNLSDEAKIYIGLPYWLSMTFETEAPGWFGQLIDLGVEVDAVDWTPKHWWQRHPKPWVRWAS